MTKRIAKLALMFVSVAALVACGDSIDSNVSKSQNQTKQFVQMLGDRALWQNFDWTRLSESNIWKASGRRNIKNSAEPEFTIVRLLDTDFQVNMNAATFIGPANKNKFSLENAGSIYLVSNSETTPTPLGKCKEVFSWVTTHFGAPTATTDASSKTYKSSPHRNLILRLAHWDAGVTRVRVVCEGYGGENVSDERSSVQISVLLSHTANIPETEPLITLVCEQNFMTSSGNKLAHDRMSIHILEYLGSGRGYVYDEDMVPLGGDRELLFGVGVADVTPTSISFKKGPKFGDNGNYREGPFNRYTIDRITGRLSGTTDNNTEISGMCQKATNKF